MSARPSWKYLSPISLRLRRLAAWVGALRRGGVGLLDRSRRRVGSVAVAVLGSLRSRPARALLARGQELLPVLRDLLEDHGLELLVELLGLGGLEGLEGLGLGGGGG